MALQLEWKVQTTIVQRELVSIKYLWLLISLYIMNANMRATDFKLDTFEIKDTFTVTGLAASAEPLQKFTRRLFACTHREQN